MISWLISGSRRFPRGLPLVWGCRALADFNMFRISLGLKMQPCRTVSLTLWPLRQNTGYSQPAEALQDELGGIPAYILLLVLMPVCVGACFAKMNSCRKKGIPAVKTGMPWWGKPGRFICLQECRRRLFPQRRRCCRPESWCR